MRLSQAQTPLLTALAACGDRPHAAFYTPGHKRGQGISAALAAVMGESIFRVDLPELPELDNLFAPEGVIRDAQELAAEAFGAEHTWFLANGSTCGIQAAVLATCRPGDQILLPRNSHQAAIAALILSGAVPIFVQPEYDPDWGIAHSITPAGVAAALAQHPNIRAVMLLYPTYYGACGDVEAIAQLAHQHQIPLLVDEAHAAHFAFHPHLPTSALAAGADLTVQSIHKTLGALTQASMLHLHSQLIDPDRISRALQLVQSTSPSYLLLASLDAARQQMAQHGTALMSRTLELAAIAGDRLSQLPHLRVLAPKPTPGCLTLDPTRLTVDVSGLRLTGFQADDLLHTQFGVTAELPGLHHLTFILSIGNTQEDIEQLVKGFEQLVSSRSGVDLSPSPLQREQLSGSPPFQGGFRGISDRSLERSLDLLGELDFLHPNNSHPNNPAFNQNLTPRDAFFAPTETVPIAQAGDRIAAELVCPYPPGIPVLIPGDRISAEALRLLQQVLAAGGVITGCADPALKTLKVVQQRTPETITEIALQ